MSDQGLHRLGLVVIGRNEVERLRACLLSAIENLSHIVYVDSGSTDGSAELATAMGVHAIELDMSVPFTAARARNFGLRTLIAQAPNIEFVQFVDGDCELIKGWLEIATEFLTRHTDFSTVFGRLIEKYPDHSIYNRMCQHEWDGPEGEVKTCGGIAMFRVSAFINADGFLEHLIAGEEPELCYRLRTQGWKIMRVPNDMALHDAAILKFSQWWQRSKRSGYAFAEGAFMHRIGAERRCVRECGRAIFWGAGLPLFAFYCLFFGNSALAWSLLIYPFQIWRVRKKIGGWKFSIFNMLAKFSELTGVLLFALMRFRGVNGKLIEYK